MPIARVIDQTQKTVQFLHNGWPITPHMKLDSPEELLDGLGKAVQVAYQKLYDAKVE